MTAPWWQTATIYQVYPRSFQDSGADGVGDLRGITARLDHVAGLGASALWLSPIFPSPMADFGYDICDYTGVDPEFGRLADLDELVAQAHARGLKVLLDLVPNHSSDEHPWFVESRSSRDSPRRDWYLWRDPAPGHRPAKPGGPGGPPNNWPSYFGGSAWQWDEATGQFYLHLFDVKQPDLNWRNPAVREAMYDVMRFWLGRGIDGFRIDVLWLLIKDETFGDSPPAPPPEHELDWSRHDHPGFQDHPETHEVVREMRGVVDEFDGDRVLIGEIYLPLERLVRYYGDALDGVHLPFNFALVTARTWDAPTIRRLVEAYEAALPEGAWPNWVLGNHDVSRIATRAGRARTRTAHMLLLTLRGTPTLYYGDELGLTDGEIPPDRVVDPQAAAGRGRDPARTPMPWDATPAAGFTADDVEPWLPLAEGHERRNVEAQAADPRSELSLVRRLLAVRAASGALTLGTIALLPATEPDELLAYVREHEGERVLVALHLGTAPRTVDLSAAGTGGELLCCTGLDREGPVDLARLELGADEGVVVALG